MQLQLIMCPVYILIYTAWQFSLLIGTSPAKTLKWKDGKLYAYPVQNKWAARDPQCIYAPFLLSTWDAYLTSLLFCFFVDSQSHPYNSMNKPALNLSWSRARRVISYRRALIGEVMRAFHCPIVILCNAQYDCLFLAHPVRRTRSLCWRGIRRPSVRPSFRPSVLPSVHSFQNASAHKIGLGGGFKTSQHYLWYLCTKSQKMLLLLHFSTDFDCDCFIW